MKILYTGVHNALYDPESGPSFEYLNFFLTFKNLPEVEVIEYPYDLILTIGKKKFNQQLLNLVEQKKPDLLFAFMYTDELDKQVLLKIKRETKTIAWFADDYWRFFNYSKEWPPYFNWIVTTYPRAVEWYQKTGYRNVIQSQWGVNPNLYNPRNVKKDVEVSFVGSYKPPRAKILGLLEKSGIHVEVFGAGWPNGRISPEKMIEIFSRTKINLNFNDRPSLFSPGVAARIFLKKSVNRIVPDFHLRDNFQACLHFSIPHTHARPFEILGCRAFLISGISENILEYYIEDKEIVIYHSTDDLIAKIKYYLPKNEKREKIAAAAYARTLREHTYKNRFTEIFRKVSV